MERAFILGNPRSGTSLLRLMLNAHGDIVSPPESGFLHWWYQKYKTWSLKDSKSEVRIREYTNDVLSSKKIESWDLPAEGLMKYIAQKSPDSYAKLGETVYLFYALKLGKTPEAVVDKNNYYITYLKELKEIWPDAKFIHLVRDGRDVACSYLEIKNLKTNSTYKPRLPDKIEDIANEWATNNRNVYNFGSSLDKSRFITVRYEDLLNETSITLSNLLSIMGLSFDERMLEYYKFSDEPVSTLDWKKKTMGSIDKSNLGKYKQILSSSEIKSFEKIAEDMLKTFGYYQ